MEGRTEGSGGEAKKTRGVPLWAEPVSRRSVLKGVGVGALALGSGGFLQACSNSIKGSGSSTAGKITIGFVSPQTGALAGFASGDNFVVDTIRSTSAYKSGFKVGSKRYTVEIIVKDSQSDPNRASQVTSDLILQNHADLVVTSSTPETTNPVATVCETQGVPCVSTVVPWEAWYFPRQADPKNPQPFKFTTMYFFGVESFGGCFIPMWDRIPTNKIVAGQWPNDPDGSAFRGAWPGMAKAAGYTMVDGGAYADGTTDYTSMINKFKAHDCEIFTNAPLPPDFNTFWKQAAQQGFKPKIATVGKALLFPRSVEALGDLGDGMSTEVWWTPRYPFKSSLTGASAAELAAAYTKETKKQWTQPLGFSHALFEVAFDVFKRTAAVDDKSAVVAAIKATDLNTVVGPISWAKGPVPNVTKTPLVGGQWGRGKDFRFDMVIVSNRAAPNIPASGKLRPIGQA